MLGLMVLKDSVCLRSLRQGPGHDWSEDGRAEPVQKAQIESHNDLVRDFFFDTIDQSVPPRCDPSDSRTARRGGLVVGCGRGSTTCQAAAPSAHDVLPIWRARIFMDLFAEHAASAARGAVRSRSIRNHNCSSDQGHGSDCRRIYCFSLPRTTTTG
jgi:hypothetical protein